MADLVTVIRRVEGPLEVFARAENPTVNTRARETRPLRQVRRNFDDRKSVERIWPELRRQCPQYVEGLPGVRARGIARRQVIRQRRRLPSFRSLLADVETPGREVEIRGYVYVEGVTPTTISNLRRAYRVNDRFLGRFEPHRPQIGRAHV